MSTAISTCFSSIISDYSCPSCARARARYLSLRASLASQLPLSLGIIESAGKGGSCSISRVRPRTRWSTMNGYVSGVAELVRRYLPPRFTTPASSRLWHHRAGESTFPLNDYHRNARTLSLDIPRIGDVPASRWILRCVLLTFFSVLGSSGIHLRHFMTFLRSLLNDRAINSGSKDSRMFLFRLIDSRKQRRSACTTS